MYSYSLCIIYLLKMIYNYLKRIKVVLCFFLFCMMTFQAGEIQKEELRTILTDLNIIGDNAADFISHEKYRTFLDRFIPNIMTQQEKPFIRVVINELMKKVPEMVNPNSLFDYINNEKISEASAEAVKIVYGEDALAQFINSREANSQADGKNEQANTEL